MTTLSKSLSFSSNQQYQLSSPPRETRKDSSYKPSHNNQPKFKFQPNFQEKSSRGTFSYTNLANSKDNHINYPQSEQSKSKTTYDPKISHNRSLVSNTNGDDGPEEGEIQYPRYPQYSNQEPVKLSRNQSNSSKVFESAQKSSGSKELSDSKKSSKKSTYIEKRFKQLRKHERHSSDGGSKSPSTPDKPKQSSAVDYGSPRLMPQKFHMRFRKLNFDHIDFSGRSFEQKLPKEPQSVQKSFRGNNHQESPWQNGQPQKNKRVADFSSSEKRNNSNQTQTSNSKSKELGQNGSLNNSFQKAKIPPKAMNGDWYCNECNNVNFARRTHCNTCNMPKPYEEILRTRSSNLGPPGLFKDTDWQCFNCLNINFQKRTTCNRCQAPKPQEYLERDAEIEDSNERMEEIDEQSKGNYIENENTRYSASNQSAFFASSGWQCDECGHLNSAKRANCTLCNMPKASDETSRAKSSNLGPPSFRKVVEWRCMECKNTNEAKRSTCSKCNAMKPQETSTKEAISEEKSDRKEPKFERYDIKLERHDSKSGRFGAKPDKYPVRLERYDFKTERDDTKSERSDTKPESYPVKPERYDSKPERYEAKSERYDIEIEKYDSKSERFETKPDKYPVRLERYDSKLEKYDAKSERYDIEIEKYDPKSERFETKPDKYPVKLERYESKPEKYDTKSERYDIKSERSETKPDKYPVKLERYDSKTERYDTKSEKSDTKPESYPVKPERYDSKPEKYDAKSERYDIEIEKFDSKSERFETKPDKYPVKPERYDSKQRYDTKSERYDAKSERYDTKSERSETKPDKYPVKLERNDSKPERYDAKSGRYDIKLEKYESKSERFETKPDKYPVKLERYGSKQERYDTKSEMYDPRSIDFNEAEDLNKKEYPKKISYSNSIKGTGEGHYSYSYQATSENIESVNENTDGSVNSERKSHFMSKNQGYYPSRVQKPSNSTSMQSFENLSYNYSARNESRNVQRERSRSFVKEKQNKTDDI